jgi:hypothetical protein
MQQTQLSSSDAGPGFPMMPGKSNHLGKQRPNPVLSPGIMVNFRENHSLASPIGFIGHIGHPLFGTM